MPISEYNQNSCLTGIESSAKPQGDRAMSKNMAPPQPHGEEPTHAEIAKRARAIWLCEGCPEGKAEEHWKEAIRQLKLDASG